MASSVTEAPYTRDILRLAAAVPNRVGFEEIEGGVEMRSKTCGSRIRIDVKTDEQGRVQSVRQAIEACAFGQASAAIMARGARGRDAGEIEASCNRIARWLAGESELPEGWEDLDLLEPALSRAGRHEAILLPFRVLAAAMREIA